MHVHNNHHHHLHPRYQISCRQGKRKEKRGGKKKRDHARSSVIERIIVSAAAYPCPHPYRHHHFPRLIQNSVITCQQIPCRQGVPQYEPSDHHRLAGVKADLARRTVPVIRRLSPNQAEKQIRADHRQTSDGDDDRSEICLC